MQDITKMLTDAELDELDRFLLNRVDETRAEQDPDFDEGIFDITTLDGFLTAIVSGPELVQPSTWLPVVWGDEEYEWASAEEFEHIFTLMVRHMNGISQLLMQAPEAFEPLVPEREVDGKTYYIYDEWCDGYLRGARITEKAWLSGDETVKRHLNLISLFGSEQGWAIQEGMNEEEILAQQANLAPAVRELHAYWLARRDEAPPASVPLRGGVKVGRNDPCPCGSGKKYKKCCLH